MNNDLKKLATVICSEEGIGISSKTIIAFCTEAEICHHDRPYDSTDVDRCIKVLSFFPEWKNKIKNISERFTEWGTIGKSWNVVEREYNNGNYKIITDLLELYSKNWKRRSSLNE